MKKYTCPVEYFPNCRVHDAGFYSSTEFFETREELMEWVLKFIDEHEIKNIYDSDGDEVGEIKYELGTHRCIGIKLKIENRYFRTIDDGTGKLIWQEKEGDI